MKTRCGTSFYIDKMFEEKVAAIKWYKNKSSNKKYYVRGCLSRNNMIYIHRFLTNCPEGLTVDHIDGNPFNNTMSNLRVCTLKENIKNRFEHPAKKGFYFDKVLNKYFAELYRDGKRIRSAGVPTPKEAREKYLEMYNNYKQRSL